MHVNIQKEVHESKHVQERHPKWEERRCHDCKQKWKCKNLPDPSQKYQVQNAGYSHHPTYVAPDFETSCYVKDSVNLAQRLKDNGIFLGGAWIWVFMFRSAKNTTITVFSSNKNIMQQKRVDYQVQD